MFGVITQGIVLFLYIICFASVLRFLGVKHVCIINDFLHMCMCIIIPFIFMIESSFIFYMLLSVFWVLLFV